MIKAAQGLWRRAAEVARESPPEFFAGYAADLKAGWYPGRTFYMGECDDTFGRALPDVTGALVAAYHYDFGQLSHLVVAPYFPDGTLNVKRKAILPAKGSRKKGVAGVFGMGRLARPITSLVATDDETLALRHDNVIAVSAVSPRVAALMRRSCPTVNLRSEDRKWLETMYKLGSHGIIVKVNDKSLCDHITDEVVAMYHDRLGVEVLTHRLAETIKHLIPLERVKIIQALKDATSINFEHVLPDDFVIYRRESEFYEMVQGRLDAVIREIEMTAMGLVITTHDGDVYAVPLNHHGIQAAVCQIMKVKLDLVDWAYRDLKEIPRMYLYRDKAIEPRAEVAKRLADVVMAVLARKARIKQ